MALRTTPQCIADPLASPESDLPVRNYCSEECGRADLLDGYDYEKPEKYDRKLTQWEEKQMSERIARIVGALRRLR